MSDYQIRFDYDGAAPRTCYSCEYPAPLAEFPSRDPYDKTPVEMCELCANTLASAAYHHPTNFPNGDVLKTVCAVGNFILAELRKPR